MSYDITVHIDNDMEKWLNDWANGKPGGYLPSIAYRVYDAWEAQRPRPLRVGDVVRWTGSVHPAYHRMPVLWIDDETGHVACRPGGGWPRFFPADDLERVDQ